MDEEVVVERLRELGLTAYQSRGYVAAVRLGSARPNDIAEAAEVPQARIYDVIDDLEDMGFLEVREQAGAKQVSAPPPTDVLDAHRDQHISEYSKTIETLVHGLDEMYGGETNTEGFVSMITMRKSARRHLHRIVADAEYWLSLILTPQFYADLEADIETALDAGVTGRLVITGETTGLSFPDRLCVRQRNTTETMALADRNYGLYSNPVPQSRSTTYLVAREAALVETFQGYFETVRRGAPALQLSNTLPRRYIDPWRAILDLQERLDDGDRLVASVTGHATVNRQSGTWTGRIVDYQLTGLVETDYSVVRPETATLTIDTGDDQLVVGDHRAGAFEASADVDIAAEGVEVRTAD